MSMEHIKQYMKQEIAQVLGEEPENIADDTNFMKIGMSSIQALKIINRMRKEFDVDISPVALFEYKTIEEFAGYLQECVDEKVSL